MKELAARCGIFCAECEHNIDLKCPGCKKCEGKVFWGHCPVAQCSIFKELKDCSECGEFPCDLLKSFAFDKDQGDQGQRIKNLIEWKKTGFDQWLAKKK